MSCRRRRRVAAADLEKSRSHSSPTDKVKRQGNQWPGRDADQTSRAAAEAEMESATGPCQSNTTGGFETRAGSKEQTALRGVPVRKAPPTCDSAPCEWAIIQSSKFVRAIPGILTRNQAQDVLAEANFGRKRGQRQDITRMARIPPEQLEQHAKELSQQPEHDGGGGVAAVPARGEAALLEAHRKQCKPGDRSGYLNLKMSHLREEEVAALVSVVSADPYFTQLGLTENLTFGAAGVERLASSALFDAGSCKILGVYLSTCSGGPEGAASLCNALMAPASPVVRCGFNFNQCGNPGAFSFANCISQSTGSLAVIGLSGNGITDEGALAIAKAMHACSIPLQKVFLGNNLICDVGAAALANAIRPGLLRLGLGDNLIGTTGLWAVRDAAKEHLSTFERCCLFGNPGLEEGTEVYFKLDELHNINLSERG